MYVCMYKAHRQTQYPMAGLAELDVVQQARGSLSHSKSRLLQGTREIDQENLDKKQAAAARCPMCVEEQLHTKTLPQIQHTHTHTTLECSMGHYRNHTQKVTSSNGRAAAAAAAEESDEDNVQANVPTLEKTKLLLLLLLQTPTGTTQTQASIRMKEGTWGQ
jgi:hypothetical protein